MFEFKIHVSVGLDCETLRFLTDLLNDDKQHDAVIAASEKLQAKTEALRSALEKT